MALALQTELEVIDFSLCPSPVGLQPGKHYRLTGLSQGSLGDYDIVALANTSTQFADAVQVFPDDANTDQTGWFGILDYNTCQLTYLHDYKNNQIAGSTNISVFPWFPANPLRVADNTVDSSSTLNLGGNAYAGQFLDNQVIANATVTVAGPAVASTELLLNSNIWKRVSFNLATAIVVRLVISNNSFLDANSLVVSGVADIGDVFISFNTFNANASLEFGNLGTLEFNYNVVSGGFIQSIPPSGFIHSIQNNIITHGGDVFVQNTPAAVTLVDNWIGGLLNLITTGGDILVNKNIFGPSSELNLTPDTAGPITFGSNALYGRASIQCVSTSASVSMIFSTILGAGQAGASYDFNFIESGNSNGAHTIQFLNQLSGALVTFDVDAGTSDVDQVTIAAGGVITCPPLSNAPQLINVYVENGTLDYNSQPATNIRLQGANSTLIGVTANAKKDGYAGALP